MASGSIEDGFSISDIRSPGMQSARLVTLTGSEPASGCESMNRTRSHLAIGPGAARTAKASIDGDMKRMACGIAHQVRSARGTRRADAFQHRRSNERREGHECGRPCIVQ